MVCGDANNRRRDDKVGSGHYNKSSGITPPSPPPPVAITSGPDPLSQYALCIAISAHGHSRSAFPRKKDHVPFLVVAAPPLVRLRLPPCIHLSFALMAGCHVTFFASPPPCVAHCTAISFPLNALLHRRCRLRRPSPSPLRCCFTVHCPRC